MNELPNKDIKITFEINQIEKEIKIIELLKDVIKNGDLDEIQLRAAASTLHSIYNGIEKILLFKLKDLKIDIETNHKWHSELLIKSRENKIIPNKLEEELRDLMGFRHFYRHAYGFMLNKENIKPLVNNMTQLFNDFKKEIN